MKYARWNGSSWEFSIVDVGLCNLYYTSLALDSNDQPRIAYYDADDLNLMYAWYGPTGIEDDITESNSPLTRVYPNPANESVEVSFFITYDSWVDMQVFNLSGRLVKTFGNSYQNGQHSISIDDLTSGTYFVKVQAGDYSSMESFVIIE